MNQHDMARRNGRRAYSVLAVICALCAIAELQIKGDAGAFVAFLVASILSVIVRHTFNPNGVEDLLQFFAPRMRSKR